MLQTGAAVSNQRMCQDSGAVVVCLKSSFWARIPLEVPPRYLGSRIRLCWSSCPQGCHFVLVRDRKASWWCRFCWLAIGRPNERRGLAFRRVRGLIALSIRWPWRLFGSCSMPLQFIMVWRCSSTTTWQRIVLLLSVMRKATFGTHKRGFSLTSRHTSLQQNFCSKHDDNHSLLTQKVINI